MGLTYVHLDMPESLLPQRLYPVQRCRRIRRWLRCSTFLRIKECRRQRDKIDLVGILETIQRLSGQNGGSGFSCRRPESQSGKGLCLSDGKTCKKSSVHPVQGSQISSLIHYGEYHGNAIWIAFCSPAKMRCFACSRHIRSFPAAFSIAFANSFRSVLLSDMPGILFSNLHCLSESSNQTPPVDFKDCV